MVEEASIKTNYEDSDSVCLRSINDKYAHIDTFTACIPFYHRRWIVLPPIPVGFLFYFNGHLISL